MGTANEGVDRLVWSAARRGGLNLNDSDSESKETKGDPFRGRKGLAQEDNGEGGCREDLHLVGDLECSNREVAYGDELEGVLDDVENCRDREFP